MVLLSPIPDGSTLVWGNTDLGLEFEVTIEVLDTNPIPEPATVQLLIVELGALGSMFNPRALVRRR